MLRIFRMFEIKLITLSFFVPQSDQIVESEGEILYLILHFHLAEGNLFSCSHYALLCLKAPRQRIEKRIDFLFSALVHSTMP